MAYVNQQKMNVCKSCKKFDNKNEEKVLMEKKELIEILQQVEGIRRRLKGKLQIV
jgi:ribosome-binding protein aMBF1 (putative translation factor)